MASPIEISHQEISLCSVLVDILITCIIPPLALLILGYVTPHRQGFFCDDRTIRLPYKEDTVSIIQCYSISYAVPILTILALEMGLLRESGPRRGCARVAGWAVPAWALRCLRFVLLFSYGMGCVNVAAQTAKITVGRPRPCFFAACKPDEALCSASHNGSSAYVASYKCTGKGRAASTAALSFPSGHASTSFFAAMFIMMYLENRTHWPDRVIVMKTAYEMLVFSLAWFTSLSRVADNKHHWEDVLAGVLLGTVTAWFWVRCVLRLPLAPTPRGSGPVPAGSATPAAPAAPATPSDADPSHSSVLTARSL